MFRQYSSNGFFMQYLLGLLAVLSVGKATGSSFLGESIQQDGVASYLCVDREQAAAFTAQGHPAELMTDGGVHCFLKPGVFSGLRAKAEAEGQGVKEPDTSQKQKKLSYFLAGVKFLQWCFGRDSSTVDRSVPKIFGKNTLPRNDLSPAGSLLTENRFKRLSLISGLAMGGDRDFFLSAGGLSPGIPVSSQALEELMLPEASIPPELASLYQSLLKRLVSLLKIIEPDTDRDLRSFCELLITVLRQATHPEFLPPDQRPPFFKLLDNLLTRLETLQQQVNSAHGDLRQVRRNLVMIQLGNATGPLMALVVLPEGDEETFARVVDELTRQEQEATGTLPVLRLKLKVPVLRLKLKNGWADALVIQGQMNRLKSQTAEVQPFPPEPGTGTGQSIPGVIHLPGKEAPQKKTSDTDSAPSQTSQPYGEKPPDSAHKRAGNTEQADGGGGGIPPDQRICSKCQRKPATGRSGLCPDCQVSPVKPPDDKRAGMPPGLLSATNPGAQAGAGWQPGLSTLPEEIKEKIFSYLSCQDWQACELIDRGCRATIKHLRLKCLCRKAAQFYRYHHPMGALYDPGSILWNDQSTTRQWLKHFNDYGEQAVQWLDQQAGHKLFPELLFFAIARVLARVKAFDVKNIHTIGHADWVKSVEVSPGGNHIAVMSNSPDHSSGIYVFADGEWQKKFPVERTHLKHAGFSPDGHYFVTISDNKNVEIFALVDGNWVYKDTIKYSERVSHASLSPNGEYVLIVSGHNFRIIGSEGEQMIAVAEVTHAHFSPDGKHLVIVSGDHNFIVIELVIGLWEEEDRFEHSGKVNSVHFSHDATRVVTASDDRTAKVIGLIDGLWQEITCFRHSGAVNNARFGPDETHIVTASDDRTARIFGLYNGTWQEKASIKHGAPVVSASFTPDRSQVLTVLNDHTVKTWKLESSPPNTATLQKTVKINAHASSQIEHTHDISFNPDGSCAAIISAGGNVSIFRFADLKRLGSIKHTDEVSSVSLSFNSSCVVIASANTINIYRYWPDDKKWRKEGSTIPLPANVSYASVRFDGMQIITVSDDGTVRMYAWSYGQWRKMMVGIQHSDKVIKARLSPDGKNVVTVSDDNVVRIYRHNGREWKEKASFRHLDTVNDVSFSPDGRHILTASADKTGRIYQLVAEEWQDITIINHNGPVQSARFSFDGEYVLTASADKTVKIYRPDGGKWQNEGTIEHYGPVKSARLSVDGRRILVTSPDYATIIYELVNGEWQVITVFQHYNPLHSADFSPDGGQVLTVSSDLKLNVWSLNQVPLFRFLNESLKRPVKTDIRPVQYIENAQKTYLSPGGDHIATWLSHISNRAVRVYSFADRQWQKKGSIQCRNLCDFSLSSDGRQVVITSSGGYPEVYRFVNRQWHPTIFSCYSRVNSASFSSDGFNIVTASEDGSIRIFDLDGEQWQEITCIEHGRPMSKVSYNPNKKQVVAVSVDNTVTIYGFDFDKRQWQEEAVVRHYNRVRNASLSPDGKYIVTASDDHTAKIHRLDDGMGQKETIIRHNGGVTSAHFSLDGKRIITTANDQTVKIFRLDGGKWQEEGFIGHDAGVNDARFSPDGNRIVIASEDGIAIICEPVDGYWQTKNIILHYASVAEACFSPDESRVLTVSRDSKLRAWSLEEGLPDVITSLAATSQNTLPEEVPVKVSQQYTIANIQCMHGASFSPDRNHLAINFGYHTVAICGFDGREWLEKTTIEYSGWVQDISFNQDGTRVLVNFEDGPGKIYRLHGGQWQEEAIIPTDSNCASFSSGGSHTVAASDHTFTINRLDNGQWREESRTPYASDKFKSVRFSPNDQFIIAISGYDLTIIEKVDKWWLEKVTLQNSYKINNVCFSPDSQYIVIASHDHFASIYRLDNGQKVAAIEHSAEVIDAHFSANGEHVMTASFDCSVKISGLVDGKWQDKATIEFPSVVIDTRFTTDARHIVIVSVDAIHIYRLDNGYWREQVTIAHSSKVQKACLSPNGDQVLTVSENREVHIGILEDIGKQ